MENSVLTLWNEIVEITKSIELEIRKHDAGNSSAGVRARKGLRILKTKAAALVKLTVENEKARKAEKVEGV